MREFIYVNVEPYVEIFTILKFLQEISLKYIIKLELGNNQSVNDVIIVRRKSFTLFW